MQNGGQRSVDINSGTGKRDIKSRDISSETEVGHQGERAELYILTHTYTLSLPLTHKLTHIQNTHTHTHTHTQREREEQER
jgi:hypothetical protein